ncbi:MAG TPA: hypothetical protein PLC76_04370 [Saprospiraceae bacterium]|jgi:hypothetical protein|nr:MAG: hypothetical protein UZ08_BCD001000067 [Candidatus Parvibacillus calidus]MBX2935556.1 hypothetical protein [Saprospiraceae bacterium]MBK7740503.1 hypothetical protein [Candidatus Parvibacillus calidus]MBX7179322.1 hypothetical protein [Saprospiraceae bacterium]MCB0591837.1 hypothetical protein [Saprospiraceae bacterium]
MNSKVDQNRNHFIHHHIESNPEPNTELSHFNNELNNLFLGHKLPQSSFKEFLKSKVHRPQVSTEFIEKIRNKITGD